MALKQSFKVRDFRNKGFFMVDDEYLNGYAKKLGTTASMVYFAICRSADKQQVAFPSQKYIAEKLGVSEVTVRRQVKKLQEWNIIKIDKIRNHEGKFLHNTYYLLDKSHWKKTSTDHQRSVGIHRSLVNKTTDHQRSHKGTHDKGTHTLYRKSDFKVTKLHGITEEHLTYIADFYSEQFGFTVPLSFVKSKYDDLINYCESKGKTYKNYFSALRNFVKQDAIKIKERSANDRNKAIDARHI